MSEKDLNQRDLENSSETASASAGAQLRALRLERGLTVEQVAAQLHLAPRQIVALETDDHAALPGMPIIRGFIRTYAKLLRVDPAPLLECLGPDDSIEKSLQPREGLSAPFSDARVPSMMDRKEGSLRWLAIGLVVVLCVTSLWATGLMGRMAAFSETAFAQIKDGVVRLLPSPSTADTATASTQPAQNPAENTTGAATPPEAAPAMQDAGEVIEPPVTAATPVDAVAPNDTQTPGTGGEQANPAPASVASSREVLEFKASQDSWVEVRQARDDTIVLSKIVQAGASESIEVREPLTVVIGNVAGMSVALRGAPVELKAGGNNVARFNVN